MLSRQFFLRLLFSVLLLVPPPSLAVAPGHRWRTAESPHFILHFHEGLHPLAQRALRALEEAHERLVPFFGEGPKQKTQVVLTDHTDAANGSATAFGRPQIVLHAAPPDDLSILGDFDDWLFILVAHEYAHVLHLGTTGGATDWLTTLFGNLFNTNAIQPRLFVEGLATYHESLFTSAGRMRSSLADMFLRADFLEDRVLSLGQLTGGPLRWPRGTAWYLYGGSFLAYVAESRGDEALRTYGRSYGSSLLPYLLDPHWKKSTDRSLASLWEEWVEVSRLRYQGQAQAVALRGPVTEAAWTSRFGANTGTPRFARDGRTLFYLEASEIRRPHLRALDLAEGRDRALREVPATGSLAPLPDGRLLVARPELFRTHRFHGDLFLVGEDGETQWTEGLRAWEADASPDGRFAVFVRRARGRSTLMRLDLADEKAEPEALYEPPGERQLFTPRISPDGRFVAFSQERAGAGRDLYVLSLETREPPRRLTDDDALDLQPAWFPDGERLLFASDRTGIFNLYEISIDGTNVFRRTNVLTGAFQPDVSPDGRWVAWTTYSSRGFDVALAPLESLGRHPVGTHVSTRPDTPQRQDGELYPVSEYRPARYLDPLAWTPYLTLASDVASGVTVWGRDPVGIHAWQLSAGLGFESRMPQAGVGYTYGHWRVQPSLGVATAERRISFEPDAFERVTTASLSLGYPLATLRTSQSFVVGYQATLFHGARRPTDPLQPVRGVASEVRAGWGLASYERPADAVSPEAGLSLSALGRLGSRALGGDFEYRILTAQAGLYLRLPWARHHVLAAIANAGTSGGEIGGRGIFSVGGPPYGASAIDTLLRLGVLGESLLRGYDPGAFVGSEFFLGSLEYRFPVAHLDAAPGWFPFYLGKLSGTLFADAGNAFDRWMPELLHPSVGAEIRLSYHLGWGALDGAFRAGAAWGFDREVGGGLHLYLGFGTYF